MDKSPNANFEYWQFIPQFFLHLQDISVLSGLLSIFILVS